MKALDEFFKKASEPAEKCAVYLASLEGFRKYCDGCEFLARVEETNSSLFPKRVFCKAEKCVK